MSGYKLHYFNVRAKGEVCRLSFALAHIDFEDVRLDGEEWAKEKASGRPPLGQVPFIVTPEGHLLAQSMAITKYICKKAGFCPSDSFDEATADMIIDGVQDLYIGAANFFDEKNEAKKLTYADVAFFEFFNGFMAMGEPVVPRQLSKFPRLVDHYNRVLNVPEIKAWVEKRPKSQI